MLRKEIILGLNQKERLDLRLEENDDVTSTIKQVTMQGSALIERTQTGTMIKIPLMAIKGMTNSIAKVRGELGIKEEDNHSRRLESPNVPDLKKNLVSISAMEDKGYKVTFSDGKVHIWKNNVKDAFSLGFRVDSLYQVDGSILGVMSYDTSLQFELWHWRFAHLHYKALPDVRQMVTGMPEFQVEKEGVCPGCAKGKLTRGPFPSSNSKTTNILQLIHSDISSRMPINSLG